MAVVEVVVVVVEGVAPETVGVVEEVAPETVVGVEAAGTAVVEGVAPETVVVDLLEIVEEGVNFVDIAGD